MRTAAQLLCSPNVSLLNLYTTLQRCPATRKTNVFPDFPLGGIDVNVDAHHDRHRERALKADNLQLLKGCQIKRHLILNVPWSRVSYKKILAIPNTELLSLTNFCVATTDVPTS